MDVAETAVKHLDAFIAQRHDKRVVKEEGHRPSEEMYMEGVRRYEDRQHRERLWERLRYHEGQARRLSATVAALVARHEAEAQRYAETLGIEDRGEGAIPVG